MFERYTESARRVIFFAREEAMRCGSPYIESEHVLLGILRENGAWAARIGGDKVSVGSHREEIERETTIRESITGSREIPLGKDSKGILLFSAEEADALGHPQIALAHFLLGILRVEKCTAARILQTHGVTLQAMREETMRDAQWTG